MSKTSLSEQENRKTQDNKFGDVLQAATTIAGLAVALAVLLPSISKLVIIKIGEAEIPLVRPLILLCGLLSLMASIWAIDSIRQEMGMPVTALLMPRSTLGLLFLALCIFLMVYLGIVISI